MGGGWRVVGASVQGASHLKTGQLCQDANHWDVLPGGILVAAVSDGAGSAALAEVGAAVAATAAVDALRQELAGMPAPTDEEGWKLLLTAALQSARDAVEQAAQTHDRSLRDLAATLIVLVVAPDGVAAAQIGDGGVVVGDDEGNVIGLTAPQSGEYINETTFLTSPDSLSAAQVVFWPGNPRNVALFSDGLQMLALKMPGGEPYPPFFSPLFRFLVNATDGAQEQLAAFLRSPRVTERADDDLTLLLAARV